MRRLLSSSSALSLPQRLGQRADALQRQLVAQQREEQLQLRLEQQQQKQQAVKEQVIKGASNDGTGNTSAAVANGGDDACALAAAMKRIEPRTRGDVALEPQECTAALELCMLYKPGAVREVQVVLREMERAGLTPSPHDLALAAATFAWNKKPKLAATMRDDALAALDSTDSPEAEVVGAYTAQDARTMHDVTCELLLESCRRSGDTAAAMSTWTWMRARSLWPTPAGLTHLLVAFARAADWRSAVTALTECDAEGRRSGTSGGGVVTKVEHWNVLLSAFVRAGELRKAEDLLRNLEQRAAVTGGEEVVTAVDTVSYNTLLFGYVTVTDEVGADAAGGSSYGDGHLGRVERFDALLRRMDEANVPRDASTYRAMINLHQLDASRVLEIAQEAEERGVAWRWRAYAAAARALLWGRRAEDARGLMRRMHEIGVEPTTDFYRILVEAAESAGLHDEADWLHREGLSRGFANLGMASKAAVRHPKGGRSDEPAGAQSVGKERTSSSTAGGAQPPEHWLR